MCKICNMDFCPPGCPNHQSDVEAVFVCSKCKRPIYEGDHAYKIDGDKVWCDDCMVDAFFKV